MMHILATYFTQCDDPQRGKPWQWDEQNPLALIASAQDKDIPITIFSDTDIPVRHTPMQCRGYPSVWRWFVYREWLKLNQPEYIFMVDSTDVEVITKPQPDVGVLYVGDEPETFRSKPAQRWFDPQIQQSPDFIKDFYRTAIEESLIVLNAGVVGGEYTVVTDFLERMCGTLEHTFAVEGVRDMPALNYTIRTQDTPYQHGYPINSVFRANMAKRGTWFKHK